MPLLPNRRRIGIAACVFVGALIPTIGFGRGLILYDSTQDVHVDPIAFIHRLLSTWTPDYFLGMHAGFMQGYLSPYAFAYALLATLHVPAVIAQRLVMFAIYAALIVSMYVSLRYITPRMHYAGRLVAAIAACWNIYVAFNSHGSSVMLLAYAAMPAFVASFAAYIDKKISLLRACSVVGLLSIFATGTNPPLLAIDACVVFMFAFVAIATARDRLGAARRFAQLAIAGGLTTLVVNLYWIVPFVDYFRTVWLGGVLSESTAMHNAATSFANTLRGFGQWAIFVGDDDGPYYLWASSYVGITIYTVATWLFVALAFLGLCFRRNAGRGQTFLLLCCACSLPLVVGYYTGALGPAITSPIYGWLFTKVPFFQMFRRRAAEVAEQKWSMRKRRLDEIAGRSPKKLLEILARHQRCTRVQSCRQCVYRLIEP